MNFYYKILDKNGLYGVGFCDSSIFEKKFAEIEIKNLTPLQITKQEFNELCQEGTKPIGYWFEIKK